MVADDFSISAKNLRDAREPEDVFGADSNERQARAIYRRLARVVHPDVAARAEADEAFRRLEDLWGRAQRLFARGQYGKNRAPSVVVRTKSATYVVGSKVAAGDFCDLFDVTIEGRTADPMVFKVARLPRDNDLVQQEARMLLRLGRELDKRWHPFLPKLVDRVEFRAPGGIRRRGNVLERLDGWHSLKDVRAAYPHGIDPRDMAWMWRRLLAILGAVHDAGVVHGAVVPSNVLIHPEKHGLVLADWAYAVDVGASPRAFSGEYRAMYPHEFREGKRISAASDLYCGAQAMLFLMGRLGAAPMPIRAYFRALALTERLRPDDAWLMLSTFDDVLERCYGRRRFRSFVMPAPA